MTDDARPSRPKPDWASRIADRVVRRHRRVAGGAERPVVVASGMSPSGPIHLGNLRELLVPHFVAEEIRSRDMTCDHLLSWDDYDRLRKVPAGVPDHFADHVGRPLTAIPDPEGELASYAERFKAPVRAAIAQLGLDIREISQTEEYGKGTYRDAILTALDRRSEINDVLDRFRTLEAGGEGADPGDDRSPAGGDETVLEGGDAEDDGSLGADYWPYKVYCQRCGRDETDLVSVERTPTSCDIAYRCRACGHHGSFDLLVENHGKLVWKVDWPMRWAHEGVDFEAGGADHSSPGSSFSVGRELVATIFDGEAPDYEAYSFVGIRGMGKLSSSAGAVPTPADALSVLEPPILRWIYVRKNPRQGITIDLGPAINALYDEWDALTAKVEAGTANPAQAQTHGRAASTSLVERFPGPELVVPFRTLTSAVSVAAGDETQTARILSELAAVPAGEVRRVEPRLGLARTWLDRYAPAEDRITVRTEPDRDRLAALDEPEARWVETLLAGLADDWSLDGLRTLAYGVPKLVAGLSIDAPPTDELKAQQRQFFKLLYQLFLSADTGPRMPTLLMALGQERVRRLLGAETE